MAVPADLLELLRCPKCRGALATAATDGGGEALDCAACRLRYPVIEDIPQMLVEEAQPLG